MLFFCDKDTCLEEAYPYPLFLVWICCHFCSKFVQLLAYFIGIVSIFQALRTKGNRWRIPVHKREGNKDSCTYKKTGLRKTPKDSFIFKGNILTLPHEVKTPGKTQLPDAVILRCAASESLLSAHKYYSREEKLCFLLCHGTSSCNEISAVVSENLCGVSP